MNPRVALVIRGTSNMVRLKFQVGGMIGSRDSGFVAVVSPCRLHGEGFVIEILD